jgi:uncharacterized protein (TIGR01244 family)
MVILGASAGATLGRRSGRVLVVLIGLFVPALLAGGARYGYWVVFEHRFAAVTPEVLYRSAEMPPDELLRTAQTYGIRTVVDLRRDSEKTRAESQALDRAGLRYVHLPSGQVPTPETLDAFLALMADPANLPVLVHCKHGEGRSVLLSAVYRIEYEGWPNDRARRATRILPSRSSFALDRRKGRFLIEYRPRRPSTVPAIAHTGAGGSRT